MPLKGDVMRKLLLIICICSLLLASCDLLLDILFSEGGSGSLNNDPVDPSFGNFWATDFKTNKDYRVDAELLAAGDYCNVWVEKGSGINNAKAREVANHYDTKIYPKMIDNFSIKNFSYKIGNNNLQFDNIMDFADWYVDDDKKLCILLLDIKDNYNGISNTSYVAGYFWSGDFLKAYEKSNERDMIYIDIKPGLDLDKIEETYKTLAHEMQHLMNFATSIYLRAPKNDQGQITGLVYMDTWIDEGLSAAAEWVYSGQYSLDRIDWFINNGQRNSLTVKGLIDKGNTFFVWNNHKENTYAVLDDYATVNLFFHWLRLQTNNNIYRQIITSAQKDYRAVANAFNTTASENYSWDELIKTWFAANYINASSGRYGYRNDTVLRNLKVPAPKTIASSISLAPGEGVYSKAALNPNFSNGTYIKYAYLTGSTLSDTFQTNSVILTYNANNDISGTNASGRTTGTPIANIGNQEERSLMPGFTGPYRIGGWDLIEREPISINQQGKRSDE